MSAYIDTLSDKEGNALYPVTKTSAVYDSDGNRLDNTLSQLNSNLTANSKAFVFDYQNGKYGYNTSTSRGADTFHPFSSGAEFMKIVSSSSNKTVTLEANTGTHYIVSMGNNSRTATITNGTITKIATWSENLNSAVFEVNKTDASLASVITFNDLYYWAIIIKG